MFQSFAPEFVTVEPPDSQDSAGRCARCKEKTSGLHPVRGSPRGSLLWRHFSSLHFLCHREESKDPRRGATPGDLEHSVSNRTTKWCLHDFLLLDFFEEKNFLIMFTVQILSHVGLFATPWTAALPAPLSFTISQNVLRFMATEEGMSSNHLILCRSLSPLALNLPSIRILPSESAPCIWWLKY